MFKRKHGMDQNVPNFDQSCQVSSIIVNGSKTDCQRHSTPDRSECVQTVHKVQTFERMITRS